MRTRQERDTERRSPRAARINFIIRAAAAKQRGGGDVRQMVWQPSSRSGGGGGGGGGFNENLENNLV